MSSGECGGMAKERVSVGVGARWVWTLSYQDGCLQVRPRPATENVQHDGVPVDMMYGRV